MSNRAEREAKGRRGEWQAAWYLRLTGWRILAQRMKCPRGEVDIIARKGRLVVFVEVKWRHSARDLDLATDHYRMRRVAAAAEALAPRYARDGDDLRIDVLLLAPGRFPRHLTNVWMP